MCRVIVSTVALTAHYTIRDAPSKPSKTASKKKAAKAARQEKKQQQGRPLPSSVDTSKPGQSPLAPTLPLAQPTPPEVRPLTASDQHSVRPSPPIEPTKPPPMGAIISPDTSALNGHLVGPNEKSSVSSFIPQLGPTTKDQPLPPVSQPSESKSRPPSTDKEPAPSSSRPVAKPEADNAAKKSHNVFVRTLWTFIMLGGFMGQSDK